MKKEDISVYSFIIFCISFISILSIALFDIRNKICVEILEIFGAFMEASFLPKLGIILGIICIGSFLLFILTIGYMEDDNNKENGN